MSPWKLMALCATLLSLTLIIGCSESSTPGTDAAVDAEPDAVPWNPPTWSLCEVNMDCTVRANTCCGVCGVPSLSDVLGANASMLEAAREEYCGSTPPPCPECAQQANPNLIGTCEDVGFPGGNMCEARDLQQLDISLCTTDDDCVLRTPTCCQPCSEMGRDAYVAINREQTAALLELVCEPTVDCPGQCTALPALVARCVAGEDPGTGGAPVARRCQVQEEPAPPPPGSDS
jgi:hypothetical protein